MRSSTARRNVARCLATTLWQLWKTGRQVPTPPRCAALADQQRPLSNTSATERSGEFLGWH